MNTFWNDRDFIYFLISLLVSLLFNIVQLVYICRERKRKKDELKRIAADKEARKLAAETWVNSFKEMNFFINNYGIIELAHGVPVFEEKHIKLSKANASCNFYYPIPIEHTLKTKKGKKTLADYNFVQNGNSFDYSQKYNCLSDNFKHNLPFKKGFSCFNREWDNQTKNELASIANEVAINFMSTLKDGIPRFNGQMFGVSSFNEERIGLQETPGVEIVFHKTDYFTYRVFSKFFENHREELLNNCNLTLTSEQINKLSYPFLSSFGVACLIVVSFNDLNMKIQPYDTILLGKRSDKVEVDKNKLHFSMNEALSITDTDNSETPSFKEAGDRGLQEELGLFRGKVEGAEFGEYGFLDFCIDSNKGEMGITCYVKVSLDSSKKTIEDFKRDFLACYKRSKDGILETTGFETIRVCEIETFKNNNKERMSNGLLAALDRFRERTNELTQMI